MKKTLLRLGRLAFCTSLLFGALTNGYAQEPNAKDKKLKVAKELRELGNKSTSAARGAQVGGLQRADLLQVKGNYVVIEAVSTDADGRVLLQQLQQMGLKNGASFGRMVSGLFPIEKIGELERVEKLRYATPAYQPMHNKGLVTSQGDISLGAEKARASFAVTGVGTKVGILSDSYGTIPGGAAAGVASGDLPNDVEVLEEFNLLGSDEGRAMAEIVHDVAPGAKIAFNTAFLGQASFANGIIRLADNGCNVIVDDVFYFAEPFFQDGIIAQAVDRVVDRNVSYFSAAGNSGRRSYESGFRNSGQSVIIGGVNYGVAHDFGGGDTRQTIVIPPSGQLRLALQWADPFFSVSGGAGAQTDLDVLVFFNNTLLGNLSSFGDNVGGDPFEFLGLNAGTGGATIEIAIVKYAGPDPALMKYIEFGNSTVTEFFTTGSTVVGHNNAAKTISVGAAPWFNTPEFNVNITRPVVESFSSLGGTPVFITTTGVNTGIDPSKIRRNPSVVGPDGGNNTFFGSDINLDDDNFPNFFGTSAAAPHVAAVAALMQQANSNRLSPQQVRDLLTSTALDMDDPFTVGVFDTGYDLRTGFGFVRAERAVALAADPCLNDVTPPVARVANIEVDLQNGTRTVLATEVNNGSTDNCRVASLSISPSTFTCANIGPNQVTLTVTDPSGNVSTAVATVTVKGTIPTPTITVTPSNSVFTGGVATTLYLGYGPQSVTLVASGGQTYSWSPSAGLSRTDIANPIFTATAAGMFTYTVTATSASGCTGTASVTLTVIDVRCSSNGKKMDKVLVCKNDKNTLCVAAEAVEGQLRSGAVLGTCGDNSPSAKAGGQLLASEGSAAATGLLEAYPNPFTTSTTFRFSTPQAGPVRVQLYNHLGQLVTTLYDGEVAADQLYERTLAPMGLASGLYTCRFTTSTGSVSQRVVLTR
ncbi:S8 family serine peptidase [Hymenobacter arizonensis]|uniref:Por secretion system C-terminal sorting domain-containing protein n=1 Tax=Hymenobacter arizonensis TaxID=1227077 RepID=A0A1I5XXQ2_HYMAR|nr:S8 family serine peptidase [Hymenobacter arizonensis]SFQ36728.1 Por secretion system C-terminal sorting domain-containing protein [Hymenobacter arizonensis]